MARDQDARVQGRSMRLRLADRQVSEARLRAAASRQQTMQLARKAKNVDPLPSRVARRTTEALSLLGAAFLRLPVVRNIPFAKTGSRAGIALFGLLSFKGHRKAVERREKTGQLKDHRQLDRVLRHNELSAEHAAGIAQVQERDAIALARMDATAQRLPPPVLERELPHPGLA